MPRREYWVIGVVAVGLVVAAVIGQHFAPGSELRDPRRSALLAGPSGAKGLAAALRDLGVEVVVRRRPLFDLTRNAEDNTDGLMLMLLDVMFAPTGVERRVLRNFVASGNTLLLAGENGVEHCFGERVSILPRGFTYVQDEPWSEFGADRGAADESRIALPAGVDTLPDLWARLEQIPADSVVRAATGAPDDCAPLLPRVVDTLLGDVGGKPIAAKLHFSGGGRVILIADSHLLANESLKDTDAGVLVLPWILRETPVRVIVDEYHQGFRLNGSIYRAVGAWLVRSPIGWVVLQLCVAAVAGLSIMAVRFGPALPAVVRKRRSPVEHVDALAAGLERSAGDREALNAFVSGLRRRLRGGMGWARDRGDLEQWLDGLALSVRTPDAQGKITRLAELMASCGPGELQEAASTVEDLWEALGRQNRPKQS